MKVLYRRQWVLLVVLMVCACGESKSQKLTPRIVEKDTTQTVERTSKFVGSKACRPCHERFYKLWDTSHHGKAMQPFTSAFAKKALTFDTPAIAIGEYQYHASLEQGKGWVIEQRGDKTTPMEILHVLGGKNVFYFLTLLDRGRLQTLPIGYDVHKKQWFDVADSGLRHFAEREDDTPLHWKDPEYTFNTSCYSCHVSQLAKNYDVKTNTYNTVWHEPGINCETCHNGAKEHIKVCEAAGKNVPDNLAITGGKGDFTPKQNNDTCSSCHAKMIPLTGDFKPADNFFDHFDLAILDHPDYYPDGRDLGENYTFTSWKMNTCTNEGNFDCIDCHTSSGRFRQADNPNQACAPCHQKNIAEVVKHSRHPATEKAPSCIDCHMPLTTFAHMNRSDHSMRPPVPAATIAFESPNACNICHKDKDAAWADKHVTRWHGTKRKDEVLQRGALVKAAREQDWSKLDDIISFIHSGQNDEILTASLLRLLIPCTDKRVIEVGVQSMNTTSALIRASAVQLLENRPDGAAINALLRATQDDTLLVRVRGAAALARFPKSVSEGEFADSVKTATQEFVASMTAQPDSYSAHFNLGNHYANRGDLDKAASAYNVSLQLRPDAVPVYVNLSLVQAKRKNGSGAMASLKKALALDGNNEGVHLNMAMLLGEKGDVAGAKKHFKKALSINPRSGQAAFNLCVLEAEQNWTAAEPLCRSAMKGEPNNDRYAYTLAFYYHANGKSAPARKILEALVAKKTKHTGVRPLLKAINSQ